MSAQLPYIVSPILYCFQNATYKVSCMFTPTSLRKQLVAIITAGGIHTGHSSNLKAHLTRVVYNPYKARFEV